MITLGCNTTWPKRLLTSTHALYAHLQFTTLTVTLQPAQLPLTAQPRHHLPLQLQHLLPLRASAASAAAGCGTSAAAIPACTCAFPAFLALLLPFAFIIPLTDSHISPSFPAGAFLTRHFAHHTQKKKQEAPATYLFSTKNILPPCLHRSHDFCTLQPPLLPAVPSPCFSHSSSPPLHCLLCFSPQATFCFGLDRHRHAGKHPSLHSLCPASPILLN